MRYSDDIGQEGDYVEYQYNRPRLYRCPTCGTNGRRIQVTSHRIAHVGLLNRRNWLHAKVGVYKAKCACCKYFQAPIPGVPAGGRYSYEVRNTIANAVIRDRMPYRLVQERMAEDYRFSLDAYEKALALNPNLLDADRGRRRVQTQLQSE